MPLSGESGDLRPRLEREPSPGLPEWGTEGLLGASRRRQRAVRAASRGPAWATARASLLCRGLSLAVTSRYFRKQTVPSTASTAQEALAGWFSEGAAGTVQPRVPHALVRLSSQRPEGVCPALLLLPEARGRARRPGLESRPSGIMMSTFREPGYEAPNRRKGWLLRSPAGI